MGGCPGSARGGELYTEPVESRWPCPAGHLLSSRVRCSALSVRTFTFSEVLRGRRGVIRLTAAVLRKRLARPRVGELSQPGRGRGSAPPMARACVGRCGGERRPDATQPPTTPQDSGPLGAPVIHGAAEREGKLCASTHGKGTCPVGSPQPAPTAAPGPQPELALRLRPGHPWWPPGAPGGRSGCWPWRRGRLESMAEGLAGPVYHCARTLPRH